MAQFVRGPVSLTVPATSANLGPGFDALGLALDLRDTLSAEIIDSGLEIEVEGAGAEEVPRDDTHLVIRAMRAAFEAMDADPPGLRLHCHNVIPHSRGLGSSSAAIVAGVSLARELIAGSRLLLDDAATFQLAARIEGHPDNVAPAFFGGFAVSGQDATGFFAVRAAVDPRVSTVVFVPPDPVSTQLARGLLPDTVSHADAAANASRSALLVAALGGRPEHLLVATEDLLHQDYRRPAMPASHAFMTALRTDGIPAIISGAGPTVLAFSDGDDAALKARCPEGWRTHALSVDTRGVLAT